MTYETREKIAYSKFGKLVAKVLKVLVYKNNRVHWIQQSMAELNFSKLTK